MLTLSEPDLQSAPSQSRAGTFFQPGASRASLHQLMQGFFLTFGQVSATMANAPEIGKDIKRRKGVYSDRYQAMRKRWSPKTAPGFSKVEPMYDVITHAVIWLSMRRSPELSDGAPHCGEAYSLLGRMFEDTGVIIDAISLEYRGTEYCRRYTLDISAISIAEFRDMLRETVTRLFVQSIYFTINGTPMVEEYPANNC